MKRKFVIPVLVLGFITANVTAKEVLFGVQTTFDFGQPDEISHGCYAIQYLRSDDICTAVPVQSYEPVSSTRLQAQCPEQFFNPMTGKKDLNQATQAFINASTVKSSRAADIAAHCRLKLQLDVNVNTPQPGERSIWRVGHFTYTP
jgi:hypothetical protein